MFNVTNFIRRQSHTVVLKYHKTFNVHGSVQRNNILVYKFQQDPHVTEFILSDNCSTCFGRHYHPYSGAQNNFNYSICNGYQML
jgi:hypothetical protein